MSEATVVELGLGETQVALASHTRLVAPTAIAAPETLRTTRPSVLPQFEADAGGELRIVHRTCERYREGARIGAGGMGEIHRAEDLDIGRAVAIKRLLPNAASPPTL